MTSDQISTRGGEVVYGGGSDPAVPPIITLADRCYCQAGELSLHGLNWILSQITSLVMRLGYNYTALSGPALSSYNWYYECFLSSATSVEYKTGGWVSNYVNNRFGHWRYWIIMREPRAGGSECKVDKIFCINLFIFGNLQQSCLQTSRIIW